ncbi:hydrogen peroxide-inducible genes activator [Roseovarius aestuariivivens]|uniref:hydrogen peroxide-inducible genes activator n=1 Tax=Roseovarius aestuariivivens TaxID=1888910 RepID=UPI001080C9B1|nr:hydrogen peroxide-inducible genes activator [Roseovarius aestuariivivens]
MTKITLRQLRYVEALARTGHFGRAAESCAISQPALSIQIKELEETLGAQLFERGAREVRPTGLGEAVIARAREVLRGVDEISEMVRAARDTLTGRLRVGVIPTIAPYLLPRLLPDLSDRFPDLDVQIRESVTPRLLTELGEGRLDTAIVALPVSDPALQEVAIFEEPLVLVEPAGATGPAPRNPQDLAGLRLLLLEEGHCFRDQALSFCNLPGQRPREGLEGTSLSTLVQMVGAGIGVTLIPGMAVEVETRSADVRVSSFDAPQPTRTIGMVWRKNSPLTEQFTGLSELVLAAAQQDATAGDPR